MLPTAVLRALVALGLLAVLTPLLPASPAAAARAIEGYADYQPAARCAPRAKPGTTEVGRWLVRRYGGGFGPISRSCGRRAPVTSEHQEGRAFDWTLNAARPADRRRAERFLQALNATDRAGNADALGRRMGVMYVIWNDRMYPAWREFRPEPYLSSSCPSRRSCSTTLRHRDHLHVSLTRRAARARTSWFARP